MKRLFLSEKNKKIAGVCGGIGEIYQVDPTVVRLIFIFLTFISGIFPLVITYIIAWMIIPKESVVKNDPLKKQDL